MDSHPFDGIDLRARPECYAIGRGEYGLFHAEPYRSELLPLWAFRTPEVAAESIERIRERYEAYAAAEDFVGMDVARMVRSTHDPSLSFTLAFAPRSGLTVASVWSSNTN